MQFTITPNQIIYAVTGHRGDKLGGWDNGAPLNQAIQRRLEGFIARAAVENPDKEIVIVTGMALGADTLWALAGINMRHHYPNVKIHAAIPFHGQEKPWPDHAQKLYHEILAQANSAHYVVDSNGKKLSKYEAAKAMHERNEYMVNICHYLIAVYDGVSSSGGTYECLKYAKQGRFVKDNDGNIIEHHYSKTLKHIYYLRFREEFQHILL